MSKSYFQKMEEVFLKKIGGQTINDYLEKLSSVEIEEMRDEISDWGIAEINQTTTLIKKFLKVDVDINFAKDLLKSNIELACEEYLGSINDTYGRELLLDTLVQYIGVRDYWPKYSEKDIDIKDFKENKVVPKIHYKMNEKKEKLVKTKAPRLI